jgi:hypothetical protein
MPENDSGSLSGMVVRGFAAQPKNRKSRYKLHSDCISHQRRTNTKIRFIYLNMTKKVIESWKHVTSIDNYEEVAGRILFTK